MYHCSKQLNSFFALFAIPYLQLGRSKSQNALQIWIQHPKIYIQ